MKKLFYVVFLIIGLVTTAQSNANKYQFSIVNTNFKTVLLNINIFQNKTFLDSNYLSIYNPNTNLNDHYFILGNDFVKSNAKSISPGYLYGPKIDSFNPTGASDIKGAIGIGAINYLFQKL